MIAKPVAMPIAYFFVIVEFFSFEKPHEQSHDDKRRNERNRKVERNVLEFVGKCVNVHKKIS